jgi:ATP-binding cassette subfamily B protein
VSTATQSVLHESSLDVPQPGPGAKLIWKAVKARRRLLVPGIVVAVCYTAFRVAVPVLLRNLVDVASGKASGVVLQTSVLAVLVLAAGLAQSVFAGLRRYSAIRLAIRIQTDLRQSLFEHFQRLSFAFHDATHTGQLMARANSDVEQVQNLVVYIPLTFANLLTFLFALGFLFWIDPLLALSAALVLPLITLSAQALAKRLAPVVWNLQQRLADLTQVVEEGFRGIRVIKALGKEDAWRARLTGAAVETQRAAVEAASLRAKYSPMTAAFSSLAVVLMMLIGGVALSKGRISIGDLLAAMFFVQFLSWPLQLMGDLAAQAQRTFVAAGRISQILQTESHIAEKPTAVSPPRTGGEVVFESVSFEYVPGKPVLKDISFRIEPGESVAFVGPTGSGKSTIAALLPRFYDATSGRVLVDGVDVRDFKLASLRSRIAVVFEDNFLFTDTVFENIAYGNPDASEEDVKRAARLAQADEFIEQLPSGYSTIVGEQGMTLSGGQRQRIAVARALLSDPEIVILDAATAAVDAGVEADLVEALSLAISGRTAIIVTDRPTTIQLAKRIFYMERGRIRAEGTHEELLEELPEYRSIMGADSKVRRSSR